MYKNASHRCHCATLNVCNDIETNCGSPIPGINPILTIKATYVLSKTVGILSKVRHFVNKEIVVMLCYSLIYPFLTYGVHVWGLTFPSFVTQLFIIQNKAIRIISFSEPKSHSEPVFKSLSLLKLNDVIELQILSFFYQWSHRLLPPCFNKYFKFTSSVHSYSKKQSCNRNLYVASVNTTQYGLRSLKFTGPHLWNSLPTSITNSNSPRIFRKTLKNSILNCYSLNYS